MKLSNIITEYLAYKRALGMNFGVEGRMFSSFCRLVGDVKMDSITVKQIQLFLIRIISDSLYCMDLPKQDVLIRYFRIQA